jgi:hypothetical protein
MVNLYNQDREVLDDLMKKATLFAIMTMRDHGQLEPTLFMHGTAGNGRFTAPYLADEEAKDDFAKLAHIACVAHGADAVVFVSEAWMSRMVQDGELDLSVPPSQAPDRREAVVLMGQIRGRYVQKPLLIERNRAGEYQGLVPGEIVEGSEAIGRFAHFLPPEKPDETTRELATEMLKQMSIVAQVSVNRQPEHGLGRARF